MKFLFSLVLREFYQSKARLIFYVLCIALGVASVSAVNGFSAQIKQATLEQSRALLGADIELTSLQVVPPQALSQIEHAPGVSRFARVSQMSSMAQGLQNEDVKLVEVRAVEGQYPLVDTFQTDPPLAFQSLQTFPEMAIVDKALAESFALTKAFASLTSSPTQFSVAMLEKLFQEKKAVKIAGRIFPILAVIQDDTSRDLTQFALGPRVYLARSAALKAQLISPTSRFRERVLVEVQTSANLADVKKQIVGATASLNLKSARVQTHIEGVGRSARPLTNLNSFLSQIALATLVLAGLGAANGVSEYLRLRTIDSAVLRSLGAPPRLGLFLYGGVTCAVALTGSFLGIIGGELLRRQVLVPLLKSFIALPLSESQVFFHSANVVVATLFSLFLLCMPQLFDTASSDVWSVLRQGSVQMRSFSRTTVVSTLCVLVFVGLFFARTAVSVRIGLASFATVVLLFTLFRSAASFCVWISARFSDHWPLFLRLASGELMSRRKNQTLTMALAGVALFTAGTVQFLKNDLLGSLEQASPQGRPNLYFLDVQKNQITGIEQVVSGLPKSTQQQTHSEVLSAPVVRARLSALNGKSVESAIGTSAEQDTQNEGQRFRDREQNITYRYDLSPGEKIEEGQFWNSKPSSLAEGNSEISLEKSFAANVGAQLGDTLTFDVQGVPVTGKVTSLRSVTWQNWRPNFFIVAHPSLFAEAPQTQLMAASVATLAERQQVQKQVAERYPNVSIIDATAVVARLASLAENIEQVTTFLAGILFVSSMLVLAAGLAASRHDRMKHFAVLRSLGASHHTLLAALATEFFAVGLIASVIGICAAWLAGYVYTSQVLEIPVTTHFASGLMTGALGVLFTLTVGVLTCVDVLWKKPLEVLRAQS